MHSVLHPGATSANPPPLPNFVSGVGQSDRFDQSESIFTIHGINKEC